MEAADGSFKRTYVYNSIATSLALRFFPQRRVIENPPGGFLFNTKPSTVRDKFITDVYITTIINLFSTVEGFLLNKNINKTEGIVFQM
jgi:hypothetical protein